MPRRPRADWPAFVNEPHDLEELAALRDAVNRGSPFGDGDWRDYTVRDLGLESGLRPRRRPKKTTVENKGRRCQSWQPRSAFFKGGCVRGVTQNP